MTVRDDPISKQEFYELKRQVRELATQSPLRSASITEGRLRVGGSAILLIDSDGGVVIEGSLDGDGNITWTGAALFEGTFTAKGTTRFEGDTTQVGAHHVQGNQDITGTLAVKGAATLENDLRVKPAGKITVEGASAATLQSGALSFATGAKLTAYATGATLQGSSAGTNVAVENGSASLNFGTRRVSCEADGILLTGPVLSTGGLNASGGLSATLPLKAGAAANVHVDSAGKLWRTS